MATLALLLALSVLATPARPHCLCGHKRGHQSEWHRTGIDVKKCHMLATPFCNAMEVAINRTRSAAAAAGTNGSVGATADVGAAYGIEAMIARKSHSRVFSFEGRSDEYARLRQMFRRDPGVTVEHACVSNRTGTATLGLAGHSSEMVTADNAKHFQQAGSGGTEEVKLVVLDDYFKNGPTLMMLKVDVQGHEQEVLEGARATINRDRPFIFYEEEFFASDPRRRGGLLLEKVLAGTSASGSYRCTCALQDCFCVP